MNIAAILLGYLGVLVLGIALLVALGLAIAGKSRAALMTFSAGLMGTAVIAALATLSFLQKGMGFYEEGSEPTIFLITLTLLLAGSGQFIAALRKSAGFGSAFACAAGSLLLLATPLLSGDAMGHLVGGALQGPFLASRPSLPWLNPGLLISLLLALSSVLIPMLPPRRRSGLLVGMTLAFLGGFGGFAAGDACVTTRTTMLRSFPGGYPCQVRVEVDLLGRRLSDETGFARIPREGLTLVRAVSLEQGAWVFGPPLLGAMAGLTVAWGIARLLVRRARHSVS